MRSCYWPRRLDKRRTVVQMAHDLSILMGPEIAAQFFAAHRHKPDARCEGYIMHGGRVEIVVARKGPQSSGCGPPPSSRRERLS